MYIAKNVAKPQGKSAGAAAPKDPNVFIAAVKDILYWPGRDPKGVLHTGNFVMKPNAKMISVYMTSSKIKAPYEGDGDEDAISVKHKFEGEHPGNELEINEFIHNWMGEPCIIIHGSCSDNFKKVAGTKCAPLQLKPSSQDDNDARKHMLVFEQFAKTSFLPGHYTGVIPVADPIAVANVSPMSVNHLLGQIYQLPSHAVTEAIEIIWASMPDGALVTLIGGGGVAPATLSSGVGVVSTTSILLKDGITWVALEGSIITLEAYSSAPNYFIERSRG